jgi:hypothetical protein
MTKHANYWQMQEQHWHSEWLNAQHHIDRLEQALVSLETLIAANVADEQLKQLVAKTVSACVRGERS